jgi:uncharacterized repeat protein (TIGR01451 family)
MKLPFAQFDASQSPVVVEVTAKVDEWADPDFPLYIAARGGFLYGWSGMNTGAILSPWTPAPPVVMPKVFTVKKEYLGPECETVAGLNFPIKYRITVDMAMWQDQMNDLEIADILPASLEYKPGTLAVAVNGPPGNPVPLPCPSMPAPYDVGVSEPPGNGASGGTLYVSPCNPVYGQPGVNDEVSIEFECFVPDGFLGLGCEYCPWSLMNDVKAGGEFVPSDPRDFSQWVSSDVWNTTIDTVQAKCMAIQKSVRLADDPLNDGLTPGDTLMYVLEFQISDYHTLEGLRVVDHLSDGQRLTFAFGPPQLTFIDQFGPGTADFVDGVTLHQSQDAAGICPPPPAGPPVMGTTDLEFLVSAAMAAAVPPQCPRHLLGFLTGGCAAGSCNSGPATGTLTFFVEVTDEFFVHDGNPNPPFPGDNYVDKDDPISNCVAMLGEVYKNVDALDIPWEVIGGASDGSCTCTRIVEGSLEKSVYAVNNVLVPPGTAPDVLPGDDVIFRIQYTIPSGDAENLVITDWLPLPVFDVGNPKANPLGSSWTFASPQPSQNRCCPPYLPLPGPGEGRCGVTHSELVNVPGVTVFVGPSPSAPLAGNSMEFSYSSPEGPYDVYNTAKTIDYLFTLKVTNEPYADGLYLGNEALECEDNTFGEHFCQAALGLVHVREPELSIKKGVIATSNTLHAEFGAYYPGTPCSFIAGPAPIPAGQPPHSNCPHVVLTGANSVTHYSLSNFIERDVRNVDAGDWVTFAVAVENTGGAPAYEVELVDTMPLDAVDAPCCFVPDYDGLDGLCVTDGAGTSLPFTVSPAGQGRIRIELTNPLPPLNLVTVGTGANIAIITFDAQLLDVSSLQSGCCSNQVELVRYTSAADTIGTPGVTWPNFVTGGFGGPFEDTATICVGPSAYGKCVQATSEAHTTPLNGTWVDATIGEIVRFRLITVIPEGTTQHLRIEDLLPVGLTYVGNPVLVFVANTPVTSPQGAFCTILGDEGTYGLCPGVNLPLALCSVSPVPPVAVSPFVFGQGQHPFFFVQTQYASTPYYDITNHDQDTNLELAIIEFNAQVDNIASNHGDPTQTDLVNQFEVTYDGACGACAPSSLSSLAHVQVVEPQLTVTKTAGPTTTQPNGTVTYTVTIAHDTSSTADAFDISFKDTLPSDLVPTGIVSCLGCSCLGSTAYWSGQDVIATCPCLKMSDTMTITYQATVSSVVQPCPKTLTNTATVTWTSLPVDGTPPGLQNLTGQSTVDDPLLQNDGERDGSDGLLGSGVLNDYQVQYSATITVQCPDLGDAPDGTNHWGFPMLACSCTAKAHFPTVYDPGLPGNAPLGPIHWSPRGLAWLGANVSGEGEADTGWDQDGFNNIQPSLGISDQDGCDDGVAAVPLSSTLSCRPGTVNFSATNPGSTQVQVYINVWFDWNCDGDWDDTIQCFDLAGVTDVWEWAVPNCLVTLNPGLNAKVTPGFLFMTPQPGQMVWMRITLTDVPVSAAGNGGPFTSPLDQGKGGSGPLGGYLYGETEDYELGPY